MDRVMRSEPKPMPPPCFDEIARGIKLSSSMILENLGITVKMSELPSAGLYNLVREEWLGSWFYGRFYALRLRPLIEPNKHQRIRALWEQIQTTRTQEMINAVLEKGQELLDER